MAEPIRNPVKIQQWRGFAGLAKSERNQAEWQRRTESRFARYSAARVETEVAMPMMYLPWIIFSAMTSMFFDAQRSDRK